MPTRPERVTAAPGGRYAYVSAAAVPRPAAIVPAPGVSITRTGLPVFPEAAAAATGIGPVAEGIDVGAGADVGASAGGEVGAGATTEVSAGGGDGGAPEPEAAPAPEEAAAAEEAAAGGGPAEEPAQAVVVAQEAAGTVVKTEPSSNAPWYILLGFGVLIMAYGAYEWSRGKEQ